MQPITPSSMFQSVGLIYGLSIPLFVLLAFILLMLPALLKPNASAEETGNAVFSYLAQLLGFLLITSGVLPALYAVFARQELSSPTYLGLILVFAVGGFLFLWHDAKLQHISSDAKAMPRMLFFLTWKFTGLLVTVFAGLSFVLRLLLNGGYTGEWWVTHLLMFLYGLAISWFTLDRSSITVVQAPARTPAKKQAVAAKKAPKPTRTKKAAKKTVKKRG